MQKSIPEEIVYIAKWMFDRKLTDMAGGNISGREGNTVYISPTGAGQEKHWRLTTDDLLTGPVDTDELISDPRLSKEGISHLLIYRNFPCVNGIIHAHPYNLLAFCAAQKVPKMLTKATQIFGEIEFIDDVPLYSRRQGELLVEKLKKKEKILCERAAAVLLPEHGIFVAGKNLYMAIDCLERLDTIAWVNIAQKMI